MKPFRTLNLILLLLFFKTAKAQISTEVSMSSKRSDFSADMFHSLDAEKKWSIYTHDQVIFQQDTTTFFTFNNFSYSLNGGFGFSINLLGDARTFYSSIGVHFQRSINHLSIYFLTTYAFNLAALNENFLVITYKYPFGKGLNLISKNEFYASFRKWSQETSFDRLKLGMEFHKTQFGFFKESIQEEEKSTLRTINFGAYLKQTF
jgi:hypothetical protein